MIPKERDKLEVTVPESGQFACIDEDKAPTKEEIMDGIREGIIYVLSGGEGQPVDEMHRELAEELAREENSHDVALRS